MQVAAKRAGMADLLAHPWVAQYHVAGHGKIAAYHGGQVTATPPTRPVPDRAPSSVLDSGAALDSAPDSHAHRQQHNPMSETIRPVRMTLLAFI